MARTPRYGPAARGSLFEALTGRPTGGLPGAGRARAGAGGGEDLRALLLAAYGPSRRDPQRPDTAAAAKGLGVSQRTVERYLAPEGRQRISRPRPQTLDRLRTSARQAVSTRRGRAAAIAPVRQGPLPRRGMSVTIGGLQGPDPDYTRQRTITMNLDPERVEGFLNAYTAGGEDQALGYLADNSANTYQIESWHFQDVSSTRLGNLYGAD